MADGAQQPTPRTRAERRRDTEHRLEHDVDLWVATASADGTPYLVPLSFEWDGATVLLSTADDSPTGRNLLRGAGIRLGLGETRDVIMIDGTVEVLSMAQLPTDRGDRFAERTGFDPRTLRSAYSWFVVTPQQLQAWREVDELAQRNLMVDGTWLA